MDAYTQAQAPPPPDHESASLMAEEPAAPAGEGGWKVESVSIRPAANGGFIVTCSKTRDAQQKSGGNGGVGSSRDYESKDYAFSTFGEVATYVAGEFGQGAAQPQAPAAPAQAAAPAVAMPKAAPPAAEEDVEAEPDEEDVEEEL